MMKKLLVLILLTTCLPSFADEIITLKGSEEGKIVSILGNFVEIETKEGIKKIVRYSNEDLMSDMVKVGFFREKNFSGQIYYSDDRFLEIKTPTGKLRIKRNQIRDIILFQG